jgi:hypothetical protein
MRTNHWQQDSAIRSCCVDKSATASRAHFFRTCRFANQCDLLIGFFVSLWSNGVISTVTEGNSWSIPYFPQLGYDRLIILVVLRWGWYLILKMFLDLAQILWSGMLSIAVHCVSLCSLLWNTSFGPRKVPEILRQGCYLILKMFLDLAQILWSGMFSIAVHLFFDCWYC